MWYKVDYNKLVVLLLPTFLRKHKLVSFLWSLLVPLVKIYDAWYLYRTNNLYGLEHTGQVCYLRGALNDKFDPVERRIWIGKANVFDTTYIYTEGELQDVYIGTEEEEDTIWIYTEGETADTGKDFIVWVPQSVYDLQLYSLRATINFYKAGGKRFELRIIN